MKLPDSRLSFTVGSVTDPLLSITIGEALDFAAASWGDSLALVDVAQNVRLDWQTFHSRSEALAQGLLALGLSPGDRIGIWSLNRYEWTLTQFAAAKAGLILVTINPAYRLAELEYALAQAGCAALILSPAFKTSDYPAMIRELVPEMLSVGDGHLSSPRLPALRYVIQMGENIDPGSRAFGAVEELGSTTLARGERTLPDGQNPDAPINIQFTSGTTGFPKGVTLSHRNILNNGYFVGRAIRLGATDRVCIPVPLYHCFGMVMGNLACVTSGAAMVLPGEGFDPAAALKAVAVEGCTALYGVPTMFIAELEHPDFESWDLSSLRTGIMAGSPCPVEIMQRVNDRMGMREVTICYGMTETSPVSFQSAVDDAIERRVSTVGRVHPHLEVKIVDPDGNTVPLGVPGELCTRGYSVMLGYWGQPNQTASVKDDDGWMHSGDIATIDGQGFCNIVGRLKDMVIRGGENLYPREIEEYLYRHPAIRDVQVFGVPDMKYGEELCAWVILNEGMILDENGLRDFCTGHISHQKVPRYIRFVPAFPMTVTGKVQKYLMREAMANELSLEAAATA